MNIWTGCSFNSPGRSDGHWWFLVFVLWVVLLQRNIWTRLSACFQALWWNTSPPGRRSTSTTGDKRPNWIPLEAGLTFPLEMETLNSTDFAQTEVVFLIRFGGQRSGQARGVSPILQPVIYAASPRWRRRMICGGTAQICSVLQVGERQCFPRTAAPPLIIENSNVNHFPAEIKSRLWRETRNSEGFPSLLTYWIRFFL